MIEKSSQLKSSLQTAQGHIFYTFQDLDKYIDNVVEYTVSGIKQGSHILLIENTKLLPAIQQKLKAVLNKEQLSNVHFKNNFDFYFSKGTFNPVIVFNHCVQFLESYIDNNISIRTWGHIEWGSMQDAQREIVQYENNRNELITLKNLTSVCAYNADRMPEEFKKALLLCHGFFMTDDELVKL
ncbi:MEDS domain-containing protein [Domibacillus indicus]|uniref:MEDS domain-containing protein n=1 Tax=Domibacillus indicus TaxID=1437523 RepID=UPI00203AC814|nr:MEDS domain-containing protein [Domibacillus indicus]MCM3789975.1 MEDS domain-containing protein [Domibacillus indicus]